MMSPSSQRKRSGSRWQRRWPVAAVGVCLVATLAFAWLAFGGVHHGTRSVVHAALAVTLLAIVALPARSLRHAGVVIPLAAASALILAPCLVGLVPAPLGLRALVAPGTIDARPGFAWWTLSLDPESTVGELTDLLLPIGALLAAAAWGAAWWRRSIVESALRVAFVVVVGFAAVHAATGKPSLLGLVPTSIEPGRRFFAPFIDPNHLGTAVALLLPSALAPALDSSRLRSARAGWAVAALAGIAMLFWIASSGAMLAGAAVVLLMAWRTNALRREQIKAAMPVLLSLAGLAAIWTLVVDPQSGATFGERVNTWVRGFRTLPSFWLAGTGGGTFSVAQEPLNTRFVSWGHAHSDYVEWAVEFGVVGLLLLVPIARRLRAGPVADDAWKPRADVLVIGIVGVLVHAAVDFPLQIPALAMGVAALWGLRRGAFESRIDVAPARLRLILAPFVALELLSSLWELRTATVDRAIEVVRDGRVSDPSVEVLERLAWWRPELALADAIDDDRLGSKDQARDKARAVVEAHPEDPRALRVAGMVLARNGALDEAEAAFQRAIERYPGDWRTWVARAQAMPKTLQPGDPPDAEPSARKVAAWKDAFRHGAPAKFIEEAWETLPVGVVWVDVAAGRDARFSEALGYYLAGHGDLDASALAYEQVWMMDPHAPPDPRYPKVLLKQGRVEEAAQVMEAFLPVADGDPRFLEIEAEVLEAQSNWSGAADVWAQLAEKHPAAVAHLLNAIKEDKGAEQALKFSEQWGLSHELDPAAHLERAELYLYLDQKQRCAQEIKASALLSDEPLQGKATTLLHICDLPPT